jgi:hypothetical protein
MLKALLLVYPKQSLFLRFLTKTFYTPLPSPIYAIYHNYLIGIGFYTTKGEVK